jgi:hypothetical protein
MRRLILLSLLALLMGLPPRTASAATITEWCFQDAGGSFSLVPNVGTGTATAGSGINTTDYTGNASTHCTAGRAWAATRWGSTFDSTDYFEFAISTVGKQNITFEFDDRASPTGPTTFELHYSADGGSNFAQFGSAQSTHGSFTTNPMNTFDLSGISALDNNANVVFRLYAYGATGSSGTWRIDNVRIDGQAPAAISLSSLAAHSTAPPEHAASVTIIVLSLVGASILWLRRLQK